MANGDIKYQEEYISNARGLNLFTCQWSPSNYEPKALIFLCHGYAMECSISMRGTGTRLAKAGFAVHGVDYEGHGKSSGLQGYISNLNDVVVEIKAAGAEDTQGSTELASAAHVVVSVEGAELADF
ncbi:unnamed protein product [Triticum turgidum subsp. durum]|uniref:Serine aminopeptidase S33 domain-containing protein n=1 Tax=Triticum turgidum subsp. durum TaxID=4567 RepID=A0A9R1AJP1_TRITD|nr:unnamed protein product [Triticum turgidum subsp. durum]